MLTDLWYTVSPKSYRVGPHKTCQWCRQDTLVSILDTTPETQYICDRCAKRGITYSTVLMDLPCEDLSKHPRERLRKARYHA